MCPYDMKTEALRICNAVKEQSFSECSRVVNLDQFVSGCIESTCNCLRGNRSYDECRCRLLTSFVSECQASDLNVDLSAWRAAQECPATCSPPFVHKDCFRNKCEPTCESLQEVEPCPLIQGVCFSGCFCPEGTVRDGDNCVSPADCKDCTCEWLGNSKFISFDRKNVEFQGNCTYVLSRDTVERKKGGGDHAYQVLVTNAMCGQSYCTEAVTVLHQQHVVQLKQSVSHEFQATVDGVILTELPYNSSWLSLTSSSVNDLKLFLPAVHLEVTSYQPDFTFSVSVPSHVFGGSMEGLCGNCNKDSEDDLTTKDGAVAANPVDFAGSWLVTETPAGVELNDNDCSSKPPVECVEHEAEGDVCKVLLEVPEFLQCHNLVDPAPYVLSCRESLCAGESHCAVVEAYARKCTLAGACPVWEFQECARSCPPGMEYRQCESSCELSCEPEPECASTLSSGCFCPATQASRNGTCVPREKCRACDDAGHSDGEEWQPDACTRCSCNDRVVLCEKRECPVDVVCEENMLPVLANGTADDCCPKYLCVPPAVTTQAPDCEEDPQTPECGYGQAMKASVDARGCRKFLCECVPADECPSVAEVTPDDLEPGMELTLDTSGCCPRHAQACNQDRCPEAPRCASYFELRRTLNSHACCPDYECVPPKDLCLYHATSDQTSLDTSPAPLPKKLGETWMDGKCKECECELGEEGLPQSRCSVKPCLTLNDHPDLSDFVLEEVLLEDECCPSFKRTACRQGDAVYPVGSGWLPNPEDACLRVECVEDATDVHKQILSQDCNATCDLGYEYRPSPDRSARCCGHCEPVACSVDGQLRDIGQAWTSPDYCTKYTCGALDGNVYVQSVTEKCPELDTQEASDFEVELLAVPGECCPQVVKTGCKYNGKVYKPGDEWRSLEDNCVTERCVLEGNVTKHREVEVCSKQCRTGWTYAEPEDERCCGECKQTYCVAGDTLYQPGATWASPDNCTTFACLQQEDQLSIASSSLVCPDLSDCPPEAIFDDGCCKQCDVTSREHKVETCSPQTLPPSSTVGILSTYHPHHGVCKNLGPVEMTECRGGCESRSYFNTDNWSQTVDCKCCQPGLQNAVEVELTCETGKILPRRVLIPTTCSCEPCGYNPGSTKGHRHWNKG